MNRPYENDCTACDQENNFILIKKYCVNINECLYNNNNLIINSDNFKTKIDTFYFDINTMKCK